MGQFAAGLRSIAGGKIHEYVTLCEETRGEAFDLMVKHTSEIGANAIVGVRYDATELAENMTEVLAYGTAVRGRAGVETRFLRETWFLGRRSLDRIRE